MPCVYELPPTLVEHLTYADRPTIYYWFWGVGAVCVLITCFLLFPRIIEFRKHAIHIRDERDKALLPFSYVACLLLVAFPLIASILKYFTLLSPISAHTIDFIIKSYEAVVLYCFTRLLIMYLGSFKNTFVALQKAPKTKFYAVAPFGCCFRPCCTPSVVRKGDFRMLYSLILQYCTLTPLFVFMLMIRTYEGSETMLLILKVLQLFSAMLAFYALLALLKASNVLLSGYAIKGKFWCIKALIIVMIVPTFILALFKHLPEENGNYDKDTMTEAYGSMIAIICFTFLSMVFLKFFKPEDALYAMHNAEKRDYAASKSMASTNSGDYDKVTNDNEEDIELQKTNLKNVDEKKMNIAGDGKDIETSNKEH